MMTVNRNGAVWPAIIGGAAFAVVAVLVHLVNQASGVPAVWMPPWQSPPLVAGMFIGGGVLIGLWGRTE